MYIVGTLEKEKCNFVLKGALEQASASKAPYLIASAL